MKGAVVALFSFGMTVTISQAVAGFGSMQARRRPVLRALCAPSAMWAPRSYGGFRRTTKRRRGQVR